MYTYRIFCMLYVVFCYRKNATGKVRFSLKTASNLTVFQMPNVPHDIPIPHTLVLDFEKTLVSSTWDRKYGWRHAKRPGVDKFLLDMAQYYEIVLYSPSMDVDPAVTSLDKAGCIMHRLYRDATFFMNGFYVKDLKRLNRNINRVVVIDDDLEENQFHPENVIRVKAYDDPTDKTDNTLARITPLLIEIAREGYDDIPGLLAQYRGMDADEIADEHERRIQQFRSMREEKMSTGLGGFAKMARKTVDIQPELDPREATFLAPTQQLTSKDLVGAAPPSSAQTDGLMGFLNRRQEEKEESTKRKYEKWQEVMMRKQKQKEELAKRDS
jgi:import inner membrane translocase subunit TIM50